MDWTILPASVTARAWLDEGYKKQLLEDPQPFLAAASRRWPTDREFKVVADDRHTHFLVLPANKANGLSPEGVLRLLEKETRGDRTLEFFVPATVTARAFFDASYKAKLLRDPAAALRALGVTPPDKTVVVVENSIVRHYLVLRENPLRHEDLSFEALRSRLIEIYGAASSQCCASGTCS